MVAAAPTPFTVPPRPSRQGVRTNGCSAQTCRTNWNARGGGGPGGGGAGEVVWKLALGRDLTGPDRPELADAARTHRLPLATGEPASGPRARAATAVNQRVRVSGVGWSEGGGLEKHARGRDEDRHQLTPPHGP